MTNEGFKTPILGVGVVDEGNSPLIDVGGVGGVDLVALVFPCVNGLLLWNLSLGDASESKALRLKHPNHHLESIIPSIFQVEKAHRQTFARGFCLGCLTSKLLFLSVGRCDGWPALLGVIVLGGLGGCLGRGFR
jgi:hypothetical protein